MIGLLILLNPALPAWAAIFSEDFEAGQGGWSAENGIWEIGTPSTVGPATCFNGSKCAGTVLNGNYPADGTDSRLVSPSIVLPTVSGTQQIYLYFREWHQYAVAGNEDDLGQVQISTWDPVAKTWSEFDSGSIGEPVRASSPVWSVKDIDLTAYAGQKIRIAFYHIDDNYWGNQAAAPGWYIDNVSVVQQTPPSDTSAFGGDFEGGWGQWSADNGVWEVGTPTAGPAACHTGTQCVGTILGGSYPNDGTVSRLFSPELPLPIVTGFDEVHLRYWEWHQYAVADHEDDRGQVSISAWDPVAKTWSAWQAIGIALRGSSALWTQKDIDLTGYAGQKIRVTFQHIDNNYWGNYAAAPGWYIDDIEIVIPPQPLKFSILQSIGLPDQNGNGTAEVATLVLERTQGDMQVWIQDGSDGTLLDTIDYGTRTGAQTPVDLAEVPDLNGNGTPEIAVLIRNANKTNSVDIRDSSSSTLLKHMDFGKFWAPSLSVLADTDGNGVPEIGVLSTTTKINKLLIRDAKSGKPVRTLVLWQQPPSTP